MDLVTLAAANKAAVSGSSIDISTNIETDKDSNTKAASPKAVNDFVTGKGYLTEHQSLANYAEKGFVDTRLTNMANSMLSRIDQKAGRTEMQQAIAAAIGNVSSFEYYLCGNGEYDAQTGVPTVQDPDTEHIYLVPTSGSNLNMYAYIGSTFTFLGTTEVDLSAYAKTSDVTAALALKADAEDVPTVPTNVSAFTNDAGYITNPKAVLWSVTPLAPEAPPEGWLGNATDALMESHDATAAEIASLQAAAQKEQIYLNSHICPATVDVDGTDVTFYYNMQGGDEGEAAFEVIDSTKPCYIVLLTEEEESASGYSVLTIWTKGAQTVALYEEGSYLTEHQSLAEYTKTSGFHQVAFSGNYNHLNNKPTIPTVPTISTDIASDAGSDAKTASPKAVKTFVENKGYLTAHQSLANVNAKKINGYTVVVQSTAPAAGTGSNQITIVVPE